MIDLNQKMKPAPTKKLKIACQQTKNFSFCQNLFQPWLK